jgi:hypothetical protein
METDTDQHVGEVLVRIDRKRLSNRTSHALHRHGHLDDTAVHTLDAADHAGGWSVDALVSIPDWDRHGLSTDLLREEPARDDFLSPEVELLGFQALKRVCHTCCDPVECREMAHLDGTALPPCVRREGG